MGRRVDLEAEFDARRRQHLGRVADGQRADGGLGEDDLGAAVEHGALHQREQRLVALGQRASAGLAGRAQVASRQPQTGVRLHQLPDGHDGAHAVPLQEPGVECLPGRQAERVRGQAKKGRGGGFRLASYRVGQDHGAVQCHIDRQRLRRGVRDRLHALGRRGPDLPTRVGRQAAVVPRQLPVHLTQIPRQGRHSGQLISAGCRELREDVSQCVGDGHRRPQAGEQHTPRDEFRHHVGDPCLRGGWVVAGQPLNKPPEPDGRSRDVRRRAHRRRAANRHFGGGEVAVAAVLRRSRDHQPVAPLERRAVHHNRQPLQQLRMPFKLGDDLPQPVGVRARNDPATAAPAHHEVAPHIGERDASEQAERRRPARPPPQVRGHRGDHAAHVASRRPAPCADLPHLPGQDRAGHLHRVTDLLQRPRARQPRAALLDTSAAGQVRAVGQVQPVRPRGGAHQHHAGV